MSIETWASRRRSVRVRPAVREAVRHEIDGDPIESSRRRLVDGLLLNIKGLVHVRAILEDRRASVKELAELTAEIERLRARLAEMVKASAA
jgi:hypothetical protein